MDSNKKTDRQGVAMTDEEITAIHSAQIKGRMQGDGIPFHVRYARAILSRASSSRAEVEKLPIWAVLNELQLVLTDPDSRLSHGAVRALEYVKTLLAAAEEK